MNNVISMNALRKPSASCRIPTMMRRAPFLRRGRAYAKGLTCSTTSDRFRDPKTAFKNGLPSGKDHGVMWHTLRHTFASQLIRKNPDVVTVKELLGHSTVVVTMRYAHTNDEAKAEARRPRQ